MSLFFKGAGARNCKKTSYFIRFSTEKKKEEAEEEEISFSRFLGTISLFSLLMGMYHGARPFYVYVYG